jgi:two-component system, NtrC family, nitrogen regulation response regulator NtrX
MASDILIVDDEADIREGVSGILSDEGHSTRTAKNSDEALAVIEARRPHLVFLDIWLQGSRLDGLQLLKIIKENNPALPVVMISGHGNIETAVSAIKLGAYDFIEKPFKADRLVLVTERALEASRLKRELSDLRTRGGINNRIIGRSASINQLRQVIERVGPTNSRVMITGAPGSGKELTARAIHETSARADGSFVVINAATITPDSMEFELFGSEAGDGRSRKIGALEEAHGGTLYIDEVADMPRETQSKILRVLVDQNFQRVGGATRVHVDVRIISSTSRDLAAAITDGGFREDLFHRLSVVPIRVPSLAERREDIPELVDFFMEQVSATTGMPRRRVGADAMAVLQSHDWPGNIRQLRNNVERLMILTGGDPDATIDADMLPSEIGALVPATPNGSGGEKLMSLPLRDAREVFEREYLVAQINRFGGNISRTAEFIGMERSALHRKLKSLGID